MRTFSLSLLFLLIFSTVVFAEEPIRVLTFNILCAGWEPEPKKDHAWDKRLPIVIDVMKNSPNEKNENNPYDFIGTQETSNNPNKPEYHQVKQLADAMTGYGSLFAPCGGKLDKFSLSNMIFWKKDRWEIDPNDSGTFWLSGTPEVPGSNDWVEENKGGERNVTYGLFHELGSNGRTGKKIYFFNTHLNVHVEIARLRSAVLIMDRIVNRKEKDAAVIVTGDFNALQSSPLIAYMQGAPLEFDGKTFNPSLSLIETFKAVHPDSTEFGTAHSYRGKISWDKKIDFIFVSDRLKPVAANVILTKKNGLYPSDHLPVDAVLEWK
ncbi:MAG: endonuclease/exonuclease/phosphatase family protein [Planctomycetaceae bacterium]|jgi:endonuclease/exonuclease/phosphatase family metal-dependent hydrolase|nr:endonuclease/exonuclease/phosphatase family protein [Planctomycetaceae bacterium]